MNNTVKTQIVAYWKQRSSQERQLIVSLAVIIAVLIYCFALVGPLVKRVHLLEKKVPQLESLARNMRTSDRIKSNTVATRSGARDLRSHVLELLAHRKLDAPVRSISTNKVEIQLPEMPAIEALLTLYGLREGTHAQVNQLEIKQNPQNSSVNMIAELGYMQ